MGLNISGIVIDKNYKDNLTELESILGEKLYFEKEVIFEEACENWKEDNYCDIYYSEKGTLVFLSMERGGFEFYVANQDSFSFVLSEMTMMFSVNYVKNGNLIRTILETEGEVMENEGVSLDFEKDKEDNSALIFHLLDKTLGESFDRIDLEAKCSRYSFKPIEGKISTTEQKTTTTSENTQKKTWWRLW